MKVLGVPVFEVPIISPFSILYSAHPSSFSHPLKFFPLYISYHCPLAEYPMIVTDSVTHIKAIRFIVFVLFKINCVFKLSLYSNPGTPCVKLCQLHISMIPCQDQVPVHCHNGSDLWSQVLPVPCESFRVHFPGNLE